MAWRFTPRRDITHEHFRRTAGGTSQAASVVDSGSEYSKTYRGWFVTPGYGSTSHYNVSAAVSSHGSYISREGSSSNVYLRKNWNHRGGMFIEATVANSENGDMGLIQGWGHIDNSAPYRDGAHVQWTIYHDGFGGNNLYSYLETYDDGSWNTIATGVELGYDLPPLIGSRLRLEVRLGYQRVLIDNQIIQEGYFGTTSPDAAHWSWGPRWAGLYAYGAGDGWRDVVIGEINPRNDRLRIAGGWRGDATGTYDYNTLAPRSINGFLEQMDLTWTADAASSSETSFGYTY